MAINFSQMQESIKGYFAKRKLVSQKYAASVMTALQDEYELIDKKKLIDKNDKDNASSADKKYAIDQQYALEQCKKIIAKHTSDPLMPLDLEDIRRFQWAIVLLYDDATLPHKVNSLVKDYKILAELNEAAAVALDNELEQLKGDPKSLRLKLSEIVKTTNELALSKSEIWRQTINLTLMSCVILSVAAIAFFVSTETFWKVVSVGILGGVVSTQQRIVVRYSADVKWVRSFVSALPFVNAALSPVLGGIGAVILYCILQSQILATLGYDSKIVPHFEYSSCLFVTQGTAATPAATPPKECLPKMSFSKVFLNNQPSTPQDTALLFLFCFLAGFSERLVPDLLDKISGNLNNAVTKPK